MKLLSIKSKLTIIYSLLIFLACSVLFVVFYFLTRNYLVYETDRSLLLHSSQIASSYESQINNVHDSQTVTILHMDETQSMGLYIEVVDTSGINTEGQLSNFVNLAKESLSKSNPVYSNAVIGGTNMRVISYPVKVQNTMIGAIVMGHPTEVYQKSLNQLKNIGIGLMIFFILPSIGVAYLLSGTVLYPLTKLSADITKINSENLNRRLNINANSLETASLLSNFNSLLDRIQKSFSLERQFLGEMAHDIKTPLAVIKSNCEYVLANERSVDEYKESTKQVLSHINKLSKNLVNLMDFAWAQDFNISKTFKKVDLSQLVAELFEVTKYVGLPNKVLVESHIENSIFVLGKEEKLYQAFYNIAENAVKFSRPKGKVILDLYKDKNFAVFVVRDFGIGITKEQMPYIFNRFYRSSSNNTKEGHGIGLAIANSVIQAHKGTISVESTENVGSVFTVKLNLNE